MRKNLSIKEFTKIKSFINKNKKLSNQKVADQVGYSVSTVLRVMKAQSFPQYQANTISRVLKESRFKKSTLMDKIKRLFKDETSL